MHHVDGGLPRDYRYYTYVQQHSTTQGDTLRQAPIAYSRNAARPVGGYEDLPKNYRPSACLTTCRHPTKM